MKSIETNRPFKISIDAIKPILIDDKEKSLISELKSSVFNKKDIVEKGIRELEEWIEEFSRKNKK